MTMAYKTAHIYGDGNSNNKNHCMHTDCFQFISVIMLINWKWKVAEGSNFVTDMSEKKQLQYTENISW